MAEQLLPAAGARPPASFSSGSHAPRAYVIITQDPDATDAFRPRLEKVRVMVNRAITNLTRQGYCARRPGAASFRRRTWWPQGLLGARSEQRHPSGGRGGGRRRVCSRRVCRPNTLLCGTGRLTDLRLAGFSDLAKRYGIRLAGSAQAGWDERTFYNPDSPILGNLVWGDLEFGKKGDGVGRKSFVSKLVSREVTKIINITPLLNHNEAGVSGNLYSLATGSVDNLIRFESNPDTLATAIPEIYACRR